MPSILTFENDRVIFDFASKTNQKIKVVGSYDNPYFSGKDICTILEYSNIKKALQVHVKPKYKKDLETLFEELKGESSSTLFGTPNTKPNYHEGRKVFINESGLFCLIMNSRASFAEIFQDLVYEQILPSIRKKGRFQLEQTIALKDDEISELKTLINEIKLQNNEMVKNEHDLRYLNDELLEPSNDQIKELLPVQERFVLIKRLAKMNSPILFDRYYAIRAQDLGVEKTLRVQESMYEIKILIDMPFHLKDKTLLNRLIEEVGEKELITYIHVK